MWLKVVVPLLAVAYVGYRVVIAVQIRRALRAGDLARVEDLRRHGLRLYRWLLLLGLLVIAFLVLLVYSGSH